MTWTEEKRLTEVAKAKRLARDLPKLRAAAAMVTVPLTNSFHGSSVRVRVPEAWMENAWQEIQAAAYADRLWKRTERRIRRELCGCADCKCGVVR